MGTEQRWARRCLGFGVAALLVTLVLSIWSPKGACGDLAPSIPPIIGFELATSVTDLAAVFGEPGACRDALAASFRVVNLIDYLFMPAYGGFLFCALAALRSTGGSIAVRVGLAAALAAPFADAIENVALLAMDVDEPGGWLFVLRIATRGKFALLAGVSAVLAIESVRRESGARRLFAVPHVAGSLLTCVALLSHGAVAAMLPALTGSWIAAVIWAGIRSYAGSPGRPSGA